MTARHVVAAAEGAIAVEREGSPMIAIVPVEEYQRLVALDMAEATED